MYIREHKLDSTRSCQVVGMHDGARPLAPFIVGGELILPCIEESTRAEEAETIWLVEADTELDEVFDRYEMAFLGSVVFGDFKGRTIYVFLELPADQPVRRITHPDLIKQMLEKESKE
jgi:hypothetical protein